MQLDIDPNLPIMFLKLAHILRKWKVSMIVNNPVGGKAKYTEKKITETEVKNEIKHRILHHTKVMAKLDPNPLFAVAKIKEGDDGDGITDNPNNPNNANERQHWVSKILHRQRLTAELSPIGNKPRSSAIYVGKRWFWIKSTANSIYCFHVALCVTEHGILSSDMRYSTFKKPVRSPTNQDLKHIII